MKNFINRALAAKKNLNELQSYLTRLRGLMLTLIILFSIGVGNAWGGTATFTPNNAHTSEGDWSLENNGVTISWHGTDDDYIKVYKGQTLTITSSNTITALDFTFQNGSNNGGWNGSTASYSESGLSTNSWSKTTTSGKSGKQARITQLVVTFSGGTSTYTVVFLNTTQSNSKALIIAQFYSFS